jgi:hypothetical protein
MSMARDMRLTLNHNAVVSVMAMHHERQNSSEEEENAVPDDSN